MTNDNAPEYVCADCGTTLDFAFAKRTDGEELHPVPQVVKQAALAQGGWRIIGEKWFCGKHELRAV